MVVRIHLESAGDYVSLMFTVVYHKIPAQKIVTTIILEIGVAKNTGSQVFAKTTDELDNNHEGIT